MEKFTKLEQMVVMNALSDYSKTADNVANKAIERARNKLMPILLSKTKEEFEAGVSETSKQLEKLGL